MKNKKKNIFISGAAGMIGSNLIRKLIYKNNIYAFDNFNLGNRKNLKEFIKVKNFFFKKVNLSKKNKFNFIKKKLDEIWLLAANSDIQKGIKNSQIDLENTFLTTFNTLESLKPFLKKETKIIFSSSSAVFGNQFKKIKEETPFKPISNYGAMKVSSEAFISAYSYNNLIKSYIFRFPNVIGGNLTHGIIYDFFKKLKSTKKNFQILGNGQQQKPFSWCDELIDCIFFLIKKKYIDKVNYFNIGTDDKGIKVSKILDIFKKKTNLKKKIKYQKQLQGWKGDIIKYQYDTKKINKLGFKFKINSLKAIVKTINENLNNV